MSERVSERNCAGAETSHKSRRHVKHDTIIRRIA